MDNIWYDFINLKNFDYDLKNYFNINVCFKKINKLKQLYVYFNSLSEIVLV